jgi:uncharacterized protein (TIGR02145 family)
LKASHSWYEPGNGLDLYGFSGLGGGYLWGNNFVGFATYSPFWTSTEMNGILWSRTLGFGDDGISKEWGAEYHGFSVRCIRDY